MDEIPKALRRKLHWMEVENMSEVLEIALLEKPKATERAKNSVIERVAKTTKKKPWKRRDRPQAKSPRERSLVIRP